MKRSELIKSKGYQVTKIQNELFREVHEYLKANKISQTQFAKELGVTKGYVSQILNGNFDFKLSKLVELSIAIGKIPEVSFKSADVFDASNSKDFKMIYLNEQKFDNKPVVAEPQKRHFKHSIRSKSLKIAK